MNEGLVLVVVVVFLVLGCCVGALINSSIIRSECNDFGKTRMGAQMYLCTKAP